VIAAAGKATVVFGACRFTAIPLVATVEVAVLDEGMAAALPPPPPPFEQAVEKAQASAASTINLEECVLRIKPPIQLEIDGRDAEKRLMVGG
jgi:hypothetical protein